MKRLCLVAAALAALIATGCGGGGGPIPPPPPPVGGFSNASLNGQYAFSMAGNDINGFFFARIGSFTADGQGHITTGLEDVNNGSGAFQLQFASSVYSIQADGRGLIQLTNATGTLQFSVTLISATKGYIVETDGFGTASGTFAIQESSAFTAGLNGSYVFDFSGMDINNLTGLSIIGQFTSTTPNAGGVISAGVLDVNDGATTPSGAQTFLNGSYQLDTNGNGTNFGRGTATFDGLTYAFYIVDGTHAKFLEEDNTGATVGDVLAQTPGMPTNASALNGSFAFLLAGSSITGPLARASRFTAGGNGGLATILVDDNTSGLYSALGPNISLASYAMDQTVAGSGRGTLTFTDSHNGTFSFVFYLISPTQAVIQDISNGITADGTLMAQTGGPFSAASLAGNYAFNWSGVSNNSQNQITAEEDFVGQYALSNAGSNNIAGAVDFSEFSAGSVFLNIIASGTQALTTDGTGRNSYTVTLTAAPSATLKFSAYVVNPNTVFLVGIDNSRVIQGVASRQP